MWLFWKGAIAKLDQGTVKISPTVHDQLWKLYKEDMVQFLESKILTFRSMRMDGRAHNDPVSRAVDDVDEYDVHDGKLVAGIVLGGNVGDGHHLARLEAALRLDGGEELLGVDRGSGRALELPP